MIVDIWAPFNIMHGVDFKDQGSVTGCVVDKLQQDADIDSFLTVSPKLVQKELEIGLALYFDDIPTQRVKSTINKELDKHETTIHITDSG